MVSPLVWVFFPERIFGVMICAERPHSGDSGIPSAKSFDVFCGSGGLLRCRALVLVKILPRK